MKDGKLIVNGQNSFVLEKFSRSLSITKVNNAKHAGAYVCHAEESNGQKIDAEAELIVNGEHFFNLFTSTFKKYVLPTLLKKNVAVT